MRRARRSPRAGMPPRRRCPDEHPAWALEADYLALGILSIVTVASPHVVIVGGGVMDRRGLLDGVRVAAARTARGLPRVTAAGPEIDRYVVAPALGDRAGVLGAIALAQSAAFDDRHPRPAALRNRAVRPMTYLMVRFPSWLCPTAEDRDRFLDMQSRVRIARIVTMFCSVAVMLTLVGRGGWPIPVFGARDARDRARRRSASGAPAAAGAVGLLHDSAEHPVDGRARSRAHRRATHRGAGGARCAGADGRSPLQQPRTDRRGTDQRGVRADRDRRRRSGVCRAPSRQPSSCR